MKILRKIFSKKFEEKKIAGFSLLGEETLDIGVFIYLMGSLDCKDLKKCIWEVYFQVRLPEIPSLLGVLGACMTFKKAEMAKTRVSVQLT